MSNLFTCSRYQTCKQYTAGGGKCCDTTTAATRSGVRQKQHEGPSRPNCYWLLLQWIEASRIALSQAGRGSSTFRAELTAIVLPWPPAMLRQLNGPSCTTCSFDVKMYIMSCRPVVRAHGTGRRSIAIRKLIVGLQTQHRQAGT